MSKPEKILAEQLQILWEDYSTLRETVFVILSSLKNGTANTNEVIRSLTNALDIEEGDNDSSQE